MRIYGTFEAFFVFLHPANVTNGLSERISSRMTQEEYKEEVKRIRPTLLSVARRYVGDDDAEDTVQDVLLRLWQMVGELRPPIAALAVVLVRNRCISLLRKQRHTIVLPDDGVSDGLPASSSSVSSDESLDHLMAIVDSLPSAQQSILRMRHMEGMNYSDIASLTGSNEVAVRKALSRARKEVRTQFLRRYWVRWAVASVAVLLLIGGATMLFLRKRPTAADSDEEFVAYIYGRRTTSQEVVLEEMQRTMSALATDGGDIVEEQLKAMFAE